MVFKVNPDILVTWPVVTITDLQKSSVAFSFQSIESMEKESLPIEEYESISCKFCTVLLPKSALSWYLNNLINNIMQTYSNAVQDFDTK